MEEHEDEMRVERGRHAGTASCSSTHRRTTRLPSMRIQLRLHLFSLARTDWPSNHSSPQSAPFTDIVPQSRQSCMMRPEEDHRSS